ncbi:hypothetical protein KI387_002885 [Taxus chinensis]|uniref:G domain-containing protein n=1 Tax=Taxus chinensis TaxID=29808 RepID=A0AA38GXB9_TAXCH|nr:hypothetical protein KI387_002885 [Taxus chinensis]
MNIIIRLAATVGAAAAAIFAYKTIISNWVVEEQYKQLGDAAAKISATSKHPPTILVMGFENHGRSSFINTVFRVLYKESGPLVMRAETGPSIKTTTTTRVFRVKNKLLRYPKYLMSLIDTPTFSESDTLDEDKLRTILRGESSWGLKQKGVPAPECVVLVVRSDAAGVGGPAYQVLPNLAKVIHEEGLQFVVMLTHKKEARKGTGPAGAN